MTTTTSERSGAPVTRRPERTRKTQLRLFEAAMAVMSEKGTGSTTVEEVAAAAGVSKGTVYYNFGSKGAMVEGLLCYGLELVMTGVADAFEAHDDPREGLTAAARWALQFLQGHPGFARLVIAEFWRPGSEKSAALSAHRQALLDQVSAMITSLAQTHPVPDQPEPRSLAVATVGSLFMLSMDHETSECERSVEDSVRTVTALVDGYLAGASTQH